MNRTLPHRGANDVGQVFGGSGDVCYVPRAMWTETFDSPLKQRGGDTKQWGLEMGKSLQRQNTMRQHITSELDKQVNHRATLKQGLADETQDLKRATIADVQRLSLQQSVEKEEKDKCRIVVKAGLDAQTADASRRMDEARMREAHEAAEVKLRTVRQLCEELTTQDLRKKAAKREADQAMKVLNDRRAQEKSDKQRDVDQQRQMYQTAALTEEYRLAAQQERLKKAQGTQEGAYRNYEATAGKENALRQSREETRLDNDEKRQQMLSELHYSRREMARDRQRQRMIHTLDAQVDDKSRGGQIYKVQKRSEKEAVKEATRSSLENDIARLNAKKKEELELQSELIRMMAEKQARAKNDGVRVPANQNTMQMTAGLLTYSSKGSKSTGCMEQRLDASKHLEKPCGRPEAKPWVELNRSLGVGGLTGVFGGEGATRPSLMATGGPNRLLHKSMELAERDKKMTSTWSEGLTSSERKIGQRAAARRGALAAADKKEVV